MELKEVRKIVRGLTELTLNEQLSENKIFNNDQYSIEDAIQYLNSELSSSVPEFKAGTAHLGKDTIMITVAFEPKEEWPHRIFENSNYFRMRIEDSGVMEVFVQSLYQKGKGSSYENRLSVKFRKAKAKSLDDAKNRILKYIQEIKQYYI